MASLNRFFVARIGARMLYRRIARFMVPGNTIFLGGWVHRLQLRVEAGSGALYPIDDRRNIAADRREEAFGIYAHPKHCRSYRREQPHLARINIRHCGSIGIHLFAKSDAAV